MLHKHFLINRYRVEQPVEHLNEENGHWLRPAPILIHLVDINYPFICSFIIKTFELMNTSIKNAQEMVDAWIKSYGVRYFSELTNMAMLTEEVGEVARIIARRYGEQSEKESDKQKVLADEMADVLWVLLCLANQTGVDLEQAFLDNIKKKTERDCLRHKQNDKLK
jgi:NTP pyrophosphatase (non-canonical NTP hydrolase)